MTQLIAVESSSTSRRNSVGSAGKLYEIPESLMAEFQAQFSERDLRVLIAYFERGSELADVRQARLASKIHKSG